MSLPATLYPTLFSPWRQGRLRLRNRIVHAAMTTRRVFDQRPTESMVQYYANRARGGAAMVVTEPLNTSRLQTRGHYVRAWNDDFADSLKRWADAVESHDCRLLGQIQDSGRGRHERGRNPNAIGASALPDDLSWTVPRVLSRDEILVMVDDFAGSAARLERCGFSGVELSAGHGHLFHQFMARRSNVRGDEFGGSLDGRLRFLTSTIAAIRAACSDGFLVGVKMPGDDGLPDGIDPGQASQIADRLTSDRSVDYVAFCQGAHARTLDWHIPDMHWPRAAWMPLIRRLRAHVHGTPVLALGLITDPAEAEGILARNESELVALGRPLVTDPAWPLKAALGREREIRFCVSCNTCWGQIVEGQPLACDNNPRVALADEVDWRPVRAKKKRAITVVGAGAAGLEAAWIAAARGHAVTVFGASTEVGGGTRLHSRLPGGESLSSVYDYQYQQARRYGVIFELGIEATEGDVLASKPDHVVLAAGASMTWPHALPVQWQADGLMLDARTAARELWDLREPQGGTAVLFDQDHTEGTYSLVEVLWRLYERVVIVTPRESIATDVPLVSRLGIHRRMAKCGVEIVPFAELSEGCVFEEARIAYRNVHTGARDAIEDVMFAAYSTPRAPRDGLLTPLRAAGTSIEAIGDCKVPRTLLAATAEGHACGVRI
jgi:2,4-dienoyl-CoA reductase-like NADH-dependent reductase (Old Yellow Enzyme family)